MMEKKDLRELTSEELAQVVAGARIPGERPR